MPFIHTKEQLNFLKENYKLLAVKELTIAFNEEYGVDRTVKQIKSTLSNHRFVSGRKFGSNKGVIRAFTEEQVVFLREGYKTLSRIDLTNAFNEKFETQKTESMISGFLKRQSIRASKTGQYVKGNIPWSAGTAGKGVMKSNSGSFKKGQKPPNLNPMYHERVDTKDGCIRIKVPVPNPHTGSKTSYRLKQRWLWEQENGPVPDGCMIIFADGNNRNFDQSNLKCITKAENLILNSVIKYRQQPEELKPTCLLLAKLKAKASKKPGA